MPSPSPDSRGLASTSPGGRGDSQTSLEGRGNSRNSTAASFEPSCVRIRRNRRMQKLHQRERAALTGAVAYEKLDFADVGKIGGSLDETFPSKILELAGERALEIASAFSEIGKTLQLGLGHHGLRQHRGASHFLRANHRLHTLMMQTEQTDESRAEYRDRNHNFEECESAQFASPCQGEVATSFLGAGEGPNSRMSFLAFHRGIPAGITSPSITATWPVSAENSSVITSPDASSRWTTVASTYPSG